MATIVWASDFLLQPTSDGRIARQVLPRIQDRSDHTVVQYAVSGLDQTMPVPFQGVKVYGTSTQGGTLGVLDFPLVDRMESADFWLLHFDPRPVRSHLQQLDLRYVLHPPVDHAPAAAAWEPLLANATEIVPRCDFGAEVIEEALAAADAGDAVADPIAHGVDTETFAPSDGTKQELLGVADDTFVVGVFPSEQSAPSDLVRQLRAFATFRDETDLEDDAVLYLHASPQGQESVDLQAVLDRLGLGDCVGLLDQGHNRWGLQDRQLPQLYNACDVVLHVTGGEAFGLPILQSFATGTPVVGSGWGATVELLSGAPDERRHDDPDGDAFVATDRGWLVPVWDEQPTADGDAWQRTFHVDHIAAALTHAYHNPGRRDDAGVSAREYALDYTWDAIADAWIAYFDALEDRVFRTDDSGVEWGKVASEQGGVDALGGDRSDE